MKKLVLVILRTKIIDIDMYLYSVSLSRRYFEGLCNVAIRRKSGASVSVSNFPSRAH